jgi:hypothetical protein
MVHIRFAMDKQSELLDLIICLRRKKCCEYGPWGISTRLICLHGLQMYQLSWPIHKLRRKLEVVSAVLDVVLIIYYFVCNLNRTQLTRVFIPIKPFQVCVI